MKNLKYIKLFEAFESTKLSKTLGFIKDKNLFIDHLKNIGLVDNEELKTMLKKSYSMFGIAK